MPQSIKQAKDQPVCEVCALTKKVRVINRSSPERSVEPLARVFSDFWGPYREPTLTGEVYMLTFMDDYTRKSWVTLTKLRTALPSVFARWKAYVEKQSGFKVKAVRCDNALEYKAMEGPILSKEGIALELTAVYSPWQNGVAERLNRTLVTMARSMLQHAKLPLRFWGFAVITACYLRNRMPIGPDGKCPEEAFTGCKVSVGHIRTFGCIAYANIPKETRGKLELVARKTILIDYLPISKQYQLYNPVTKEIVIALVSTFVENEFWEWLDEPEEEGVDVESLDPMEPVDFDLNELLGTHTEHPRADSPAAEAGNGEPAAQEQPQEAVTDVIRHQDVANDDLRPQGASGEEIADGDTIVVDTGSPVDARNNPQEGSPSQAEGAQAPQRRSGRERRPTRFFEQVLAAQDRPAIPTSYDEAVNDRLYGVY